ncbi:MAG: anhydro-N-acetylmuramic acid kinase [Synechococcus sp.]|nr:anhydro-N-acetylmuramic acid kinase [Synechococcus sp.]
MATTVLGLMSGTSADGVDGVLVEFSGPPSRPHWRILESAHHPYPEALRQQLVGAGQGLSLSAEGWLQLRQQITEQQARCARASDPQQRAQLVGCHGQTLWHQPPQDNQRGASWQCLDGPLLAELLQRPVVCDFRSADLARGGHGAPLVPLTDAALVPAIGGWRALLNLGGIANLTLLPPSAGPDRHQAIRGWDCGPANSLLDLAVAQFSGGRLSYDQGGAWAQQGTANETIVQQWLREPYFQQSPPKSSGREQFGQADLQRRLQQLQQACPAGVSLTAADALASLSALTAAVVAADLARGPAVVELLVAGGGCRNGALMQQLRQRCRGLWLRPLDAIGIDPQQREALAFALLAWWRQLGVAAANPAVTGAERSGSLGVLINP